MKRTAISIVVLGFFIVFAGCATLPLESRLDKPVSMTGMSDITVKSFAVEKQAFWLFWGLTPLIVPKVDEVVGVEASSHAGVQNLKITTEYTFLDYVISWFTGGFLHSRTVTIEGEVYD